LGCGLITCCGLGPPARGALASDVFRVHLETLLNLNTIQILDPDQEEVYKVPLIITKQHLFCLLPTMLSTYAVCSAGLTARTVKAVLSVFTDDDLSSDKYDDDLVCVRLCSTNTGHQRLLTKIDYMQRSPKGKESIAGNAHGTRFKKI